MSTPKKQSDTHLNPYLRAVLGALIMGLGLGIAIAIGEWGSLRYGWTEPVHQIVQALLCSALVVPSILFLRRRIDRRPLRGLGLPGVRKSFYTFGLGIGATLGSALIIFGVGTAIGWLRWHSADWATLSAFLLNTAVLIFFFEALPEELALRGYVYRNLNTQVSRWLAAGLTSILFLLLPIAHIVHSLVLTLVGESAPPFALAPAGEDPISYYTFLFTFSIILVFARVTTGSLWTAIGLHLTFLLINRIILGAASATGVTLETSPQVMMILVPAYISCTAIVLAMVAEWRNQPIDWRAVRPEETSSDKTVGETG